MKRTRVPCLILGLLVLLNGGAIHAKDWVIHAGILIDAVADGVADAPRRQVCPASSTVSVC
jgi:hypothetical protein